MLQKLCYNARKVLFLGILLSLFSQPKATAQEWASIGAEWTYGLSIGFANFYNYSYEKWQCVGDTSIQNKICRKIEVLTEGIGLPIYPANHNPIFSYEDSGRVFLFNVQSDTFTLLYNFNAVIGDKWLTKIEDCEYEYEIIEVGFDSISSEQRRSFTIETCPSSNDCFRFRIVEGIGNLFSMLPTIAYSHQQCELLSHSDHYYEGIRCYSDSILGQIIFQEDIDCLASNVSVNEIAINSGFNVYPNPSNGFFSIEFNQQSFIQSKIDVIDMMGKTVYIETSLTNNNQIDLSYLPKGVYFLRLSEISTGEILGTERLVLAR